MSTGKHATLATLEAAEVRAEKELLFTIVCKNSGQPYTYDLNRRTYSKKFPEIVGIIAWALYRLRHRQGHLTRVAILEKIFAFFNFLESIGILYPSELSRATLVAYAEWLKRRQRISYSTAANMFRSAKTLFAEMARHPKINDDFTCPKNAFPRSSELITSSHGYDQAELKNIVNAAIKGMRESAAKLEVSYRPKWKGLPPPIDDVAPETATGRRSKWRSLNYRIWWWENNCGCKRLNSSPLFKLPKGQSFFRWMSPSGQGSVELLNRFYDEIGAGPEYEPKYIGRPAPIKYLSPWQKREYVIWFWENHLDCRPLSGPEAKKASPDFYGAIRDHFDASFRAFFASLGIGRWIQPVDLIPYYLMLLIRTQLNPSTLQRLTVNCLIADPLNSERLSIDWTKFRSHRRGRTIPAMKGEDSWPAMLIQRVIGITSSIRLQGQSSLWIANYNRYRETAALSSATFEKGLRDFSTKYDLRGSNGLPLSVKAHLIRPTMAWNEYLRTEDMMYLRTLLGHSKLSTTADYLRRLEDPILRTRRAVHQEAMFLGLSGQSDKSQNLIASEGVLNHCKAPLESPVLGQPTGQYCAAGHEVCLGCQNLVITIEDIKKFFCFMIFHDHLLQVGDIDEAEFGKATAEKKFVWEQYILPKYETALIQRIRTEAQISPISVWDIAVYEGTKR